MLVGVCWKRSQLVLTANLRSRPFTSLQMGSPSKLTSTAGFLLKKILGGSALMPSMFLGMILLVSIDGEDAVERDHAVLDGEAFGDFFGDLRGLFLLQRREIGLGDLEVREAHEPLGERDLRVGLDLDGAEVRLGRRRALRRIRHRGVCRHLLLIVPGGDLRLIDDERRAALGDVLPGPAAIGRRRLGGLGRRLGRGRGRLCRRLRRSRLRGFRVDGRQPGAGDEIRAGDERDDAPRAPEPIIHGHVGFSRSAPLRSPNRAPSSPGGTARSGGRSLVR